MNPGLSPDDGENEQGTRDGAAPYRWKRAFGGKFHSPFYAPLSRSPRFTFETAVRRSEGDTPLFLPSTVSQRDGARNSRFH